MPIDASHFSMVGFPVEMTEAGLSRAAQDYLASCTPSSLTPSDVICLVKDPSGGELRLALRKEGFGAAALVTMNPGFAGEGRVKLEIVSDVSDPAEKPFEVTLTAHFAGEQTPLVFDLADPSQAAKLQPGVTITVDLAAFSFEPQVYTDDAAFIRDQDMAGGSVKFAPTYFVPSGMFLKSVGGEMPDGTDRPVGYADFAGKVLKAELRANQAGSGHFWWALVQTYGGATVDVVIDPRTLRTAPKPGEVLAGRFWLSARYVPAA